MSDQLRFEMPGLELLPTDIQRPWFSSSKASVAIQCVFHISDWLGAQQKIFKATPERLCTQDVMQLLFTVYKNGRLSRLVVDEVVFVTRVLHESYGSQLWIGSLHLCKQPQRVGVH